MVMTGFWGSFKIVQGSIRSIMGFGAIEAIRA